jgi:conjugative relaxase-like TrwC/TraI family protein
MLSISSPITSAAGVLSYHAEHFAAGDYYERAGKVPGQWFGRGAESLGLSGDVSLDDFAALANNRRPAAAGGGKLTARDTEGRRVAQDFTLAPPKSVSIAGLVDGDSRVIEAHRAAVQAAATELERFAAVRIRDRNHADFGKDRITGNIIAAMFEHDTSRAASEGLRPDPQLHTHLVIFNATRDEDGSFKALQNFEMLRAQKLVNAVYEHELCKGLRAAGYEIRNKGNSFELANISDKEIEHFSKRHFAIQSRVEELKAQGALRNEKDLAEAVAHDERIRKSVTDNSSALLENWREQQAAVRGSLSAADLPGAATSASPLSLDESIQFSKEHIFERAALARDVDLLASVLQHSRGRADLDLQAVRDAVGKDGELVTSSDGRQVTTQGVLANERAAVSMVAGGKGKYSPLAASLTGERAAKLDDMQRAAAQAIIGSKDFVSVFRGGAGTGKSFTLAAVKESIEAAGGQVLAIAPQNKQVQALQKDGFAGARTLAGFLQTKEPPPRGAVLLVDEAGQISGRDMRALLAKAQADGLRVVLSGDTRQHGAVQASNALEAIEWFANPTKAELSGEAAIKRQENVLYRSAVADAEAGRVASAIEKLDQLGSIRETDNALGAVAASASAGFAKGESLLVLSQTNSGVESLNREIRTQLVKSGVVEAGREVAALRLVDATEAQKSRMETYSGGRFLVSNSKGDNWQAGEKLQVVRAAGNRGLVAVNEAGREVKISRRNLARFSVAAATKIEVGRGDKVQLRGNLREGKSLVASNREVLTVQDVREDGTILARNSKGKEINIPANFGRLSHGYALTSYSSQGATVDRVLVADSGSKGASGQKEFYVSISRGRQSVEIFTSDKEDLLARSGREDVGTIAMGAVAGRGGSLQERFGERDERKVFSASAEKDEITQVAKITQKDNNMELNEKEKQAIAQAMTEKEAAHKELQAIQDAGLSGTDRAIDAAGVYQKAGENYEAVERAAKQAAAQRRAEQEKAAENLREQDQPGQENDWEASENEAARVEKAQAEKEAAAKHLKALQDAGLSGTDAAIDAARESRDADMRAFEAETAFTQAADQRRAEKEKEAERLREEAEKEELEQDQPAKEQETQITQETEEAEMEEPSAESETSEKTSKEDEFFAQFKHGKDIPAGEAANEQEQEADKSAENER